MQAGLALPDDPYGPPSAPSRIGAVETNRVACLRAHLPAAKGGSDEQWVDMQFTYTYLDQPDGSGGMKPRWQATDIKMDVVDDAARSECLALADHGFR